MELHAICVATPFALYHVCFVVRPSNCVLIQALPHGLCVCVPRRVQRLQSGRVGRVGLVQQVMWGRRDGTAARSGEARPARRQGMSSSSGDQVVWQCSGLSLQQQLVGHQHCYQHEVSALWRSPFATRRRHRRTPHSRCIIH